MAIDTALHQGAYKHDNQQRFESWANRWKEHTGHLPALPKTRFIHCYWCNVEMVVPYHATGDRHVCGESCAWEIREHYA